MYEFSQLSREYPKLNMQLMKLKSEIKNLKDSFWYNNFFYQSSQIALKQWQINLLSYIDQENGKGSITTTASFEDCIEAYFKNQKRLYSDPLIKDILDDDIKNILDEIYKNLSGFKKNRGYVPHDAIAVELLKYQSIG